MIGAPAAVPGRCGARFPTPSTVRHPYSAGVRIREARPDEADELSALALRSKGYWGYPADFLASCRPRLTLRPDEVVARRVVVAEDPQTGRTVGVGSLEGEPPHGAIGLLFVVPDLIRSGVGALLYAHLLETARGLGFRRLAIDSDPHAVGFYQALGARYAAGGALPRLYADLGVRPDWARAWTGGRRAVQVGNVAEFQAQFGPLTAATRLAGRHYACMAAFGSPHPAALVLPGTVPDGWLTLLRHRLGWCAVEVYDGLCDGTDGRGDRTDGLSAEVLARPALVERLRGLGLPFVPWGHTAAAGRLSGDVLPPGALRHESKRAAHALFARLAPAHPGIAVPDQWVAAGRVAAAGRALGLVRAGGGVLKTEHGVGGSGTRVVTRARDLLPALRGLPGGPLLVERRMTAGGPPLDLTYDGIVTASGAVHDVGVGAMDVATAAYLGVTVGPGAVPTGLEAVARGFGRAVGRELAADGYHGWYDVDFVAAGPGLLAPTEINLRLTGPAAAFMVKARLDETRGGDHVVRALDHVPLAARLPAGHLMSFLADLTRRCAAAGAVLVPSIPTAAFDPAPFVGVLLAAPARSAVAAAEAAVRAAAEDTGRIFDTGPR